MSSPQRAARSAWSAALAEGNTVATSEWSANLSTLKPSSRIAARSGSGTEPRGAPSFGYSTATATLKNCCSWGVNARARISAGDRARSRSSGVSSSRRTASCSVEPLA